jgi:hypothetical protein
MLGDLLAAIDTLRTALEQLFRQVQSASVANPHAEVMHLQETVARATALLDTINAPSWRILPPPQQGEYLVLASHVQTARSPSCGGK